MTLVPMGYYIWICPLYYLYDLVHLPNM